MFVFCNPCAHAGSHQQGYAQKLCSVTLKGLPFHDPIIHCMLIFKYEYMAPLWPYVKPMPNLSLPVGIAISQMPWGWGADVFNLYWVCLLHYHPLLHLGYIKMFENELYYPTFCYPKNRVLAMFSVVHAQE